MTEFNVFNTSVILKQAKAMICNAYQIERLSVRSIR